MNYQDFVTTHRKTGADITVAALPTDEKQATAFGLMKIDGTGRIQVTGTYPLLVPSSLCMSTAPSSSGLVILAARRHKLLSRQLLSPGHQSGDMLCSVLHTLACNELIKIAYIH